MRVPDIETVTDLVCLAVALERGGSERFRNMAARTREQGRDDVARLLERLAGDDADHAARLEQAEGGAGDATVGPEDDWLSAVGGTAEALAPTSLYDCLAQAVREKDKAFRLFSYLAAEARDSDVQGRAERLAKEKLAQAQDLRRARRQAYHLEERPAGPWPKPAAIATLDDLCWPALRIERSLAGRLEAGASRLSSSVAPSLARALEDIDAAILAELGGAPTRDSGAESSDRSDADILRSMLREAKAAFAFYDAVTDSTQREEVMLKAQVLSGLALDRITELRNAVL